MLLTPADALVAAALNLPFLLARPEDPLLAGTLPRSLAIGLALFAAPGLPLASLALKRRGGSPLAFLWVLASSALAGAAVAAVLALAGRAGEASPFWSGLWLATNAAWLARAAAGGAPWSAFLPRRRSLLVGLLLFGAVFAAAHHAATRVVPPMEDHDYETQGTGWGLLTKGRPELKTDRGTELYFAHPPLLHWLVAESFLAWDRAERLAAYAAPATVEELYAAFRRDPATTPTRAPNMLLAALTAALLGAWAARLSARPWLGLLAGAAYATSPEVFVRSGYGGYFAIGQLATLAVLLADERRRREPGPGADRDALLAGAFAALADHKLVFLPLALAAWDAWGRAARRAGERRGLHPAAAGFLLGTAAFWAWGLAVDAGAFWLDHARSHLLDRVLHRNPLGYEGYPGPAALWLELARHTGGLLLPLGAAALAAGASARAPTERDEARARLAWILLAALAFTLVDWRQTKHLMPLLIPLFLEPARWAATSRTGLRAAAGGLALLAAWNLLAVGALCRDFASFSVTPAW